MGSLANYNIHNVFLRRLNDDTNIRALFERALNSLPPEESVEVWERFAQFEQTYGGLASMLKVQFMDIWTCSSKDMDYLACQEWLVKNNNKKVEKSILSNGVGSLGAEKGSAGLPNNAKTSATYAKVVYPDTSRMIIYDPRQKQGAALLPNTTVHVLPVASNSVIPAPAAPLDGGTGTTKALNEILKVVPPALVLFVTHLPSVDGNCCCR